MCSKPICRKRIEKRKWRRKQLAGINSYVLDSYALIGFLENEKFASRVERLLKQA